MRAHEWLGTCARGRWPVGPPDDCLSAAQSAASPTGSIPPRPRRNRQTGIRPATRSDGPGFDSALTFYITASVLPLGAVRRDRQRHLPVTRRAGTLCTLSRADRRPRRLRGHGEAVWRISWPPAVRDGPVHRGRPCHQAWARGTPFRGSQWVRSGYSSLSRSSTRADPGYRMVARCAHVGDPSDPRRLGTR